MCSLCFKRSKMHRASRIFAPALVTPKNAAPRPVEPTSRSQRLMTELGLIKPAGNGLYQVMPLAQRALDKCAQLVQQQMDAVGGQKMSLSVLTPSALWEKSGRLKGDIGEFFTLRDRHDKEFLLSPTHEEAVTAMLATAAPISYRQLPLRLYQIGPKFRDELKPRFGLMRAKEFLMKDLYTFDRGEMEARESYELVNAAYDALFRQLEVPFIRVEASSGMMGGSQSHEFHYAAITGEDRILRCTDCGYAANTEVAATLSKCPQCDGSGIDELRGIEVGHTFLLGDKYSKPLGATFLQENGKPTPLIMGCYGIGISRLLAAALEVQSSETDLCWPALLAPFTVCVIGPKQGSKEQSRAEPVEAALCSSLVDICGADEVLQDDRKFLTIGKRLLDAKRMGYPAIVVVGAKSATETPTLELHLGARTMELTASEVLSAIRKHSDQTQRLLSHSL